LIKKYAFANNPVKEGEKFTDHIGTIVVEKIEVTTSLFGLPSCMYFGTVLRKDGTPTKKNEKRWAYQTNKLKA
jgi:hypothetical protein